MNRQSKALRRRGDAAVLAYRLGEVEESISILNGIQDIYGVTALGGVLFAIASTTARTQKDLHGEIVKVSGANESTSAVVYQFLKCAEQNDLFGCMWYWKRDVVRDQDCLGALSATVLAMAAAQPP